MSISRSLKLWFCTKYNSYDIWNLHSPQTSLALSVETYAFGEVTSGEVTAANTLTPPHTHTSYPSEISFDWCCCCFSYDRVGGGFCMTEDHRVVRCIPHYLLLTTNPIPSDRSSPACNRSHNHPTNLPTSHPPTHQTYAQCDVRAQVSELMWVTLAANSAGGMAHPR